VDNLGITANTAADIVESSRAQLGAQSLSWPYLDELKLSRSQRLQRLAFLGGSDANVILSANSERILQLWREKRGEAEPQDLSTSIAVMLGNWTEAFNRQWYEGLTGERVVNCGRVVNCSKYEWRACTLDGVLEGSGAVWEAKHTSAFAKGDEVLERYMPQLQHNMAVAGAEAAVLSVIFGNHKYEVFEVASDWLYQLELLEAEESFWDCVLSGQEPVPADPPRPPRPVGTREICFEGNNAWASAACDWLQHNAAAKIHAKATGLIKDLVEADVKRAFGHGIEAKRSKSGALSIRELV
jgi:predicted phage-related endonuclease